MFNWCKRNIIDTYWYYDTLNIQFLIYFQNLMRVTLSYTIISYKYAQCIATVGWKNVDTQEIHSKISLVNCSHQK